MSRKTLPLAVVVAVLAAVAPASATPLTDPPLVEPSSEANALTAAPLVELVETTAAEAPAGPPPVEVLRAWDTERARAWARGSPRMLARLYTTGSVAGRRDLAMLRAWTDRGLRVRGLRTQLLTVRELAHTGSAWTLLVTDRLVGGVAVGRGVRRALPRDEATTRTVRLRLVGGRWRVSEVMPQSD